MSVEFTIKPMDDHIRVEVVGKIDSYEDIVRLGKAYEHKANELNLKCILIDYRKIEGTMGYYGMLKLANHIESTKFHYNRFRVANLVAPDALRRFKEYQVPAANRGFIFESFTEEKEALEWLFAE